MLDISMFRNNVDDIRADHDKRKIPHNNIDEVIRLDNEWRKTRFDVDILRKSRNEAAKDIGKAKKSGNEVVVQTLLRQKVLKLMICIVSR